ncbi:hypothetical protein [Micromonospora avicenniae]|uniref:hypothetical protein n=1 Tax=Micromonospora avicenniae TaxID=1198245 RepID=UPI001588403C|nr:hypothetical protein [Micromonospora avicenniae]
MTTPLDTVRLAPGDDAVGVTAEQLRDIVGRLIAAGPWRDGDLGILIVADARLDASRMAFLLRTQSAIASEAFSNSARPAFKAIPVARRLANSSGCRSRTSPGSVCPIARSRRAITNGSAGSMKPIVAKVGQTGSLGAGHISDA